MGYSATTPDKNRLLRCQLNGVQTTAVLDTFLGVTISTSSQSSAGNQGNSRSMVHKPLRRRVPVQSVHVHIPEACRSFPRLDDGVPIVPCSLSWLYPVRRNLFPSNSSSCTAQPYALRYCHTKSHSSYLTHRIFLKIHRDNSASN